MPLTKVKLHQRRAKSTLTESKESSARVECGPGEERTNSRPSLNLHAVERLALPKIKIAEDFAEASKKTGMLDFAQVTNDAQLPE